MSVNEFGTLPFYFWALGQRVEKERERERDTHTHTHTHKRTTEIGTCRFWPWAIKYKKKGKRNIENIEIGTLPVFGRGP